MHTSQLVESFTITLGTAQTRATHNLRLLVTDENSEIFCPDIQDTGRELAYRAQNANNLYSDQLSAMVVLVDIKEVQIERSTLNDKPFNRGWTRYRNGQGSNQGKTDYKCMKNFSKADGSLIIPPSKHCSPDAINRRSFTSQTLILNFKQLKMIISTTKKQWMKAIFLLLGTPIYL